MFHIITDASQFRCKMVANLSKSTTESAIGPSWTIRNGKKSVGIVLLLYVGFVIVYWMLKSNAIKQLKIEEDLEKNCCSSPEENLQTQCSRVVTPDVYGMTSTALSNITTIISGPGSIRVHIVTLDKKHRSKSNGGDIITVFAKQHKKDGRVPGTVIDHKNGTYTGFIKVFWRGHTYVYVKLASSIQNTCLRLKALQKYGNIVYILPNPYGLNGMFIKNDTVEKTPCNTNNFIHGSMHVCNFTALNGGMSWFCGRPSKENLTCAHLTSFLLGHFSRPVDTINKEDKIQDPGHGMFRTVTTVKIRSASKRYALLYCKERSPLESWTESAPSGYFVNRSWVPANCQTSLKHTIYNYRLCLENKTIIMLGDSTVRQYANFFIENVLNLVSNMKNGLTFGPNLKTYHGKNTFTNYGITIIYRKQAMPLHHAEHEIPIRNIESFPQFLQSLARSDINSNSMIILLNYDAHFSAFPPVKYRERLRHLASAIKRFLERKPSAKIFFKGPSVCILNSKWWDPHISLLFGEILKEEFADIMHSVVYLNVWDIAVAHNVEDVHPQGDALRSQIHQFMSFLC